MAERIRFTRAARRSGGTLAVTIPPEIQRALGMKEGQQVDVYMTDDRKIVIQLKEER